MQWLINLVAEKVIAEIGIPPCYIERPTGSVDFEKDTHLITDDAWHELDISSIVGVGAKAVLFHLRGESNDISGCVRLKNKSQAGFATHCTLRLQVAGHPIAGHYVVAVGADRIIEYKIENIVWIMLLLTVKGWWK